MKLKIMRVSRAELNILVLLWCWRSIESLLVWMFPAAGLQAPAASCCTQYCILCPFQPWNFCSRNCSFHEGHGERHHPSNLAPSKLETYHQVSELVTWKGCFTEAKKLVAFVRLRSGYVENLLSVTINFSFYGHFFQLVTSRSYKYCQCRHLFP